MLAGGVGCEGGGSAGGDGGGNAVATVMEKPGKAALASPSDTEMTMDALLPTSASDGAPESRPVCVLKLSHEGRADTVKVSVSPSASDAVGWNCQGLPATAEVVGAPLITGGELASPGAGVGSEASSASGRQPANTTLVRIAASPTHQFRVLIPFSGSSAMHFWPERFMDGVRRRRY